MNCKKSTLKPRSTRDHRRMEHQKQAEEEQKHHRDQKDTDRGKPPWKGTKKHNRSNVEEVW